jgi:hypothetical protein
MSGADGYLWVYFVPLLDPIIQLVPRLRLLRVGSRCDHVCVLAAVCASIPEKEAHSNVHPDHAVALKCLQVRLDSTHQFSFGLD